MKSYIALDRVTDDISTSIISEKELTQEQVFSFMKQFIADKGSFFDVVKTKSYKTLKGLLNELWQYREWKDMSPEQAFLCGQLYGCVKLCEYREQSHQDTAQIKYLLTKYADSRLFSIIKKHPGIRHKELAKEIGLTTGRLSQMMDDEDMKELIINRVLGREKYYFLGAKGEELFQKLEAQKRKARKEEMRKRKTEKENSEWLDFMAKNWSVANTNVNMPHNLDIPKENPVIQRHLAEIYEISKNYLNLENELTMGKTVEEEKECLTEENSYCGQSTNLLKNGLVISSVG